MSNMILSVVIPTFNRAAVLCETLDALLVQEPSELGCEILVVDDGSTDDTPSRVQSYVDQGAPIRFFACAHRGPAAARNVGIDHARGDLILFTGDDMLTPPHFLQAHIAAHAAQPASQIAIVGDVRWCPQLTITPFMRWLDHGGPYFHFHGFSDGDTVDHGSFITANLSLKRAFLAVERFDETFAWAAFEDIELGYRLMHRGLELFFKSIPVHHLHPVTLKGVTRRMYNTGRAACQLERKWPGFPGLGYIQHPRLYPLLRHERVSAGVERCVRQVVRFLGRRAPIALYRYIISYARWRGYVDAQQAETWGSDPYLDTLALPEDV
jgi:glycosyltransferase involved in cell wall biosynthesis